MIKKIKIILFLVISVAIAIIIKNVIINNKIERVAHAGGGYNGKTYTDSIDALNFNKNKYELFEIDLLFTLDSKIICLHDWDYSFKKTFDLNEAYVPTYEKFKDLVFKNSKYKNCTFETLTIWLKENKNKKIVTDVKDKNYEVLEYFIKNFPDAENQIIPQIYSPKEYDAVKKLGYKNIILTLYMYGVSDEQLIAEVKNQNYYAITIHHKRAIALAPKLKSLGFNIYAHTVNDPILLDDLKKVGVDEIYTDWLNK